MYTIMKMYIFFILQNPLPAVKVYKVLMWLVTLYPGMEVQRSSVHCVSTPVSGHLIRTNLKYKDESD